MITRNVTKRLAFCAFLILCSLSCLRGQSQGITYQGKLTDGGLPASGSYDLRFKLFELATGDNQVLNTPTIGKEDVMVIGGIFTVELDFGTESFTSQVANYLEIAVRPGASTGTYTILNPRQSITSVPHAIFSKRAYQADNALVAQIASDATSLGGTAASQYVLTLDPRLSDARPPTAGSANYIQNGTGVQPLSNFNISGDGAIGGNFSVTGSINGNGSGLTNLNPANIAPGTAPINIAGSAAKSMNVTSGTTPSVAGLTTLVLEYPSSASLSNLTNSVVGQCVTLIVAGQPVGIISGGNFRLTSNWTGQINDTLTICRHVTTGVDVWIEQGRSSNAPFVNLNVSSGSNGMIYVGSDSSLSCVGNCSFETRVGTKKMLSAVAFPGYGFSGWSGGCSGTDPCFLTVTGNTGVAANFQRQEYTVHVVKTGSGTGTVTSSPAGIFCGALCAAAYIGDTTVTLTATPASGSSFTGWSGGGCSGTGACTIAIFTNMVITANFSPPVRELTVTKDGNGSGTVTTNPVGINCGSDCSESYPVGSLVELFATPSFASNFTGWSGGGCSGTSRCIVTMDNAHAVTATFTLQTFQLNVFKYGAGSGFVGSGPSGIECGPTCSAPFFYSTQVTLRAEAAEGSVFTGWSGDCIGTEPVCIVTIDTDRNVIANFSPSLAPVKGVRP